MAQKVDMGQPFTPPPPPKYDTQIELPSDLPQYQIKHSVVGLWFEGEIVDADQFEGGTAEIARLLTLGAIGAIDRNLINPITNTGRPISAASALARTGGAAVITRPTTEQLIASAVAALSKG